MTTFQLPDLTDGALKKAGITLGIKDAEKLNKEQLIQEIKKVSKTEGELLLVPLVIAPLPQATPPPLAPLPVQVTVTPPDEGKWWWVPATLLLLSSLGTVATAFLTYSISVANADSAKSAQQSVKTAQESAKTARDQHMSEIQKIRETADKEIQIARADVRQSWQDIMVYDIISHGEKEKENWNGLTLAEIKKRYRTEATQGVLAKEVELGDKDVSDAAIKRVLFSLMKSGVVEETVEDRYVVEKTVVNPRWQRGASQILISSEIMLLLLSEKRMESYSEESLFRALTAKVPMNVQDYQVVLAALQSVGQVRIEEGKVWSPANPPKKNGDSKK